MFQFNNVIQMVKESGLIQKWMQQNQMSATVRREVGIANITINTRGISGEIGGFSTTFLLPLLVGWISGTLLILLELLVVRCIQHRRIYARPIWRLLNFLLTPQRSWFHRRPTFQND